VSGAVSNYHLDMKPTIFDPEAAHLVAELVCDLIADERDVEALGGVELGAVPIIIAVCAGLLPGDGRTGEALQPP
jgi:orotate phosphoribosyltransferase